MKTLCVLVTITEVGTKVIAVFDTVQDANDYAAYYDVIGWNILEVPHLTTEYLDSQVH